MDRVDAGETRLVTGTDFITQPVRDYDAAARFYGETLGLRFSKRWGSMPAGEFETGSLTIALMEPGAFGMKAGPSATAIAFHVKDVKAARAELERKGVEFKGATIDSGECLQAIFDDADGNVLILHNRYAPDPPSSAAAGRPIAA